MIPTEVPERIGYLILLYMHQLISPEQHNELDKWIESSDDHMKTFEELTDIDSAMLFFINDLQ